MANDLELVKKLREQTGAGMLDVKNALEATNGDYNKAIAWLEEKGIAKANRKAGRITADGLVRAIAHGNQAVIFELNCETDFVALTDDFKHLMDKIGNAIVNSKTKISKVEEVMIDGKPINEITTAATAKIGEKISFRRFDVIHKTDNQVFGIYNHANGKISSIVVLESQKEEIAKNVSMHLSAMNPSYMTKDHVPYEVISKHKKDIMAEMKDVNKPDNIKEMMAEGKLKKILSEVVLLEQEFVMEAKKSVANYLKEHNATYIFAIRYEVGEGIEKIEIDFASEVKSQMK